MTSPGTVSSSLRRPILSQRLGRIALLAFLLWVIFDLVVPTKHDIRQFDARTVATMETSMWRSYYERKPVLLFWQLASGLRQQFHTRFWRSFRLGYQATKSAFVFKRGKTREDYQRALPELISYYESIHSLSTNAFDVDKVAALELDWWIVHRQRERYSYADLANALAATAAAQYNLPVAPFRTYAQLRANAMRMRDESVLKPGGTTETDWNVIEQELDRAWSALHEAVQPIR